MRRRSGFGVVPAVLAWTVSTSAVAQPGDPPVTEEGPAAAPETEEPAIEPTTEPAAGPQGSGVLALPPTIQGDGPEHIAGALQQGVRDGLTDAGHEVVEAPDCTDATCAGQAVADGRARAYVSTDVRVTGSDYVLTTELLDGQGSSLARKEGSCEICTYEEAAVALRELVAATARELGPPPEAVPAPVVEPDPANAPRKRMSMSPKTTQIIAFTAIGVGVAALAGGIALLVIDDNPVKGNCAGANVDADGDCAFRYDTLGGGIGLTVAGAVVAGGGVGLYLWSRKQGKAAPAEVSLVPWGLRARF